jgi:hypothetical protein
MSRVGRVWAHALAYVGLARAYVLGEDGAALAAGSSHAISSVNSGRMQPTMAPPTTVPSQRGVASIPLTAALDVDADDAGPWEQRVRWRLVLATRWIALMLVCWSGLYIGLLTWTSTNAPVSCALLENPESTGCYAIASGNHVVYVRPRVYTVVALLTNSFLFASTVWSGISQLERIGHLRSRRTFRFTLLRSLFFQASIIFCLFCKIFSDVRFNGGAFVFFTFCEDVAMLGYLWTLAFHIETAAKRRRATGKVADAARHIKDQLIHYAAVARDYVKAKGGRWWTRIWRVERSTEPHHSEGGGHETPMTINRGNMNVDGRMSSLTPVLNDTNNAASDLPAGGSSERERGNAIKSTYSLGASVTGAGVGLQTMLSSQHSRTSSGMQRMNSTFDFFNVTNPQQLQQTTTTATTISGSDTVAAAALESSAFSPSQRQPPSQLDVHELNVEPPPSRRGGNQNHGNRGNVGSSKTIGRHNDASSAASASSTDPAHAGTDCSTPRDGLGAAPSGRSTRAPSSAVASEPTLLENESSPLHLLDVDHIHLHATRSDSDGLKPNSQSAVDHIAELLHDQQRRGSTSMGGVVDDAQLESTLTSTQNSNLPLDSLFSFVEAPRTPQEGAGGGGGTTTSTAASPHATIEADHIAEDDDTSEDVREGDAGDASLTDRTSGTASRNR